MGGGSGGEGRTSKAVGCAAGGDAAQYHALDVKLPQEVVRLVAQLGAGPLRGAEEAPAGALG